MEDLLIKVERLKSMLVSKATGGNGDDAEYRELRIELINNPIVKDKLPRCVKSSRGLDEFWAFIQPKFAHYAQRRNFLQEEFDSLLNFLEQSSQSPSDQIISEMLNKVDSSSVQAAWHKALERRTTDPEGAITSARTLLEAVCKYILDEEQITYNEKDDLPKLYSLVAAQLNLSPSQHTERLFKQILGGCHAIVEGLGALRSKLGDAHARGKTAPRPHPRHAELAVNLAGTMATFILATWEQKHTA